MSSSIPFLPNNTINERVPSDILYIIFSYFGEEETPESPLEILLFVCRTWYNVALRHRQIWAKVNVMLKDRASAILWSRRIARRMERLEPSGSASTPCPIFFEMRVDEAVALHSRCRIRRCKICLDASTIKKQTERILRAVLGGNGSGSLCAGWREIKLSHLQISCLPFFAYPTPQLITLQLDAVRYRPRNVPFLPSVPSLREFHINFCGLPYLPNISNVVKVHIGANFDARNQIDNIDLHGLLDVKKAEHLELNIGIVPWYSLPINLSYLVHLHLAGLLLPNNILVIQFPCLRELSTQLEDFGYEHVEELLECNGVPFDRLEALTIRFYGSYYPNIEAPL